MPPRLANIAAPDPDGVLAQLPTLEEIAARIRRQPIGAVIADICRDLGIMPSNKLWPELRDLIISHGGSLARLVNDIFDRTLPLPVPVGVLAKWPLSSPLPWAASTGPP